LREKRFLEEYQRAPNARQAAIAAGYSPSSASRSANRLLKKPEVRRALEVAGAARGIEVQLDAETILRELKYVALARADMFLVASDGTVTTRPGVDPNFIAAVAGVKRRTVTDFDGRVKEHSASLKLWDKNKALMLSMKNLGLITDRLTIETPELVARELIAKSAAVYDRRLSGLVARKKARKLN